MPTIKELSGPYRIFFYSFDCNEQMHVHVQRESMLCKFWLSPIILAKNKGFVPKELTLIRSIIMSNKDRIKEAWHEHCGETARSKN